MKCNRGNVGIGLAVAVLTAMTHPSISAQQAADPAPRTRPAAEVFAQLGQSAGVVVLDEELKGAAGGK